MEEGRGVASRQRKEGKKGGEGEGDVQSVPR